MENALGQPQTIVLLGGSSDIGLAIVRRLLNPATTAVVLACRDVERGERAAAGLRHRQLDVDVVAFDARASDTHEALTHSLSNKYGDIDVAIVAFGLLGEGAVTSVDPEAAAEIAQVNFTGVVSSTIAIANQMRLQGHGSIVMLSSVAGERVRSVNPVYGGTKAGIDGFAQGLGDALVADGVRMLIVRPGFVHSQMTAGRKAAPLATTPERVADVTVKALRSRRRIVWAPPMLRPLFAVLRHLPGPLWRRLPLG
ncbi:MAG TPA: decaprenylphospho-beta-D-erythro-pentofuranosid-2-ulose 2-reductase [Ilumatobacteraceae bacterium]|nr:decaprenylphospho-beta-D-erythro-pentofuranosid-2-ulose 2-reductase [Ilumatobacteraceae bacterium]